MSTHTQTYLEQLAAEGYRPRVEEDGEIIFKAEGKPYYLYADPEDPQFVRLGAYGVWPIGGPDELAVALRVASGVSARFKAAKAFVVNDETVFVTLEVLVTSPAAFGELLPRLVSILQDAARAFSAEMREALEELAPIARA